MRYAQRGGYTPAEPQRREGLRLGAARRGAGATGDEAGGGGGGGVEGRGGARYKGAARAGGSFFCSGEGAAGGRGPPKGRTWAPRGARPVVRVRGAGGGRVSIAGVACYRPGDRPHLFYQLRVYRRRKGEPKGFSWSDYRDLIIATHPPLAPPLARTCVHLNIHLAPG